MNLAGEAIHYTHPVVSGRQHENSFEHKCLSNKIRWFRNVIPRTPEVEKLWEVGRDHKMRLHATSVPACVWLHREHRSKMRSHAAAWFRLNTRSMIFSHGNNWRQSNEDWWICCAMRLDKGQVGINQWELTFRGCLSTQCTYSVIPIQYNPWPRTRLYIGSRNYAFTCFTLQIKL